MTPLSSGVLLKLVDGMKSSAAKPVGEHLTAVLLVTDIVLAALDEKGLFLKHGKFYVKVSDASHSIDATLPLAQADLVLSDKATSFTSGSSSTSTASTRPPPSPSSSAPGRHPLVVGTPDQAGRAKPNAPRTGSWGPEQNAAIKPTTLNFDVERRTLVEERPALSTPVV